MDILHAVTMQKLFLTLWRLNIMTKTNYKKIDIYFMGSYVASTTWRKTCKEAKKSYAEKQGISEDFIKAVFSKD